MIKHGKIDCHTHIVNKKIRKQYLESSGGGDYAVVMEFLPHMVREDLPDESWDLCDGDDRLFLCPSIDIHGDILPQLTRIEEKMAVRPACRVVGLKLFLTYQTGRANAKELLPIYDFARKHGLSVTFHTGLPSYYLPHDHDMEGCHSKYIREVALLYPDVNFILAHMDDPRYDECLQIIHGIPNMFTDFCGAFEPGTKVAENEEGTIAEFAHAIHQFSDSYQQILYGTDYCPPILLSELEKYDDTIDKIFTKDQHADIYWNNPLRAFPKIAQYLLQKKGENNES